MNQKFLETIFGTDWGSCHVTSFQDDPDNISEKRKGICWKGDWISEYKSALPPGNQYFTVSRFRLLNDRAVKRKSQFIAIYVIAADDVREKLPLVQLKKLPPPTYKLLTSAESEQWGWVLNSPCTDRVKAENLLDGLISHGLAPDGKDPGMKGVTRYMRLPDGVNTKKSRLIDGAPFQCRLLEFSPWQSVNIESLAAPFGVDLSAERRESRTEGACDVDHPITEVVEVKQMISDGRYDITCPWVDEHTDTQDNGTAVFSNDDLSIGFKCHHGHCQEKTGKDLMDWIEKKYPGWSKKLEQWKIYTSFGIEKKISECREKKNEPILSPVNTLLSELRRIPAAEAVQHVYQILKLTDTLDEYVEKMKVWEYIKDYMKWTDRHFQIILKEQRKIWYQPNIKLIEKQPLTKSIPSWGFPSVREPKGTPRATIENLRYMMDCYGITASYNQITKKIIISIPGIDSEIEGGATITLEKIISLGYMNDLPASQIPNQITALSYSSPVNPVTEHLRQLPYAGTGYIQMLADCLHVDESSESIRNQIFRMYMTGACAAADSAVNTPCPGALPKFEYVMILAGDQGIEKTKFFRHMMPRKLRKFFKDGQFLDPSDKDSVLKNIQYWINELGELDGIFKKTDIARLKAFLSESEDVLRQPYGRCTETYIRRSIFAGSVNEQEFLKDYTGNRRYWPLSVNDITLPEDQIIIDAAWAEAWYSYINGEKWWPSPELDIELNTHRLTFQSAITDEPVEDALKCLIEKKFGMFSKDIMTISDIRIGLRTAGLTGHEVQKIPSNAVLGKILNRHRLGISVKTKSKRYWVVRNFPNYEGLKSSEIENYYNSAI